jgi:hypothetical protein
MLHAGLFLWCQLHCVQLAGRLSNGQWSSVYLLCCVSDSSLNLIESETAAGPLMFSGLSQFSGVGQALPAGSFARSHESYTCLPIHMQVGVARNSQ